MKNILILLGLGLCASLAIAEERAEIPWNAIKILNLRKILNCKGCLTQFNEFGPISFSLGGIELVDFQWQDIVQYQVADKDDGSTNLSWNRIHIRAGHYKLNGLLGGLLEGEGHVDFYVHGLVVNMHMKEKLENWKNMKLHSLIIRKIDLDISGIRVLGKDVSNIANAFVNEYLLEVIDIVQYLLMSILSKTSPEAFADDIGAYLEISGECTVCVGLAALP